MLVEWHMIIGISYQGYHSTWNGLVGISQAQLLKYSNRELNFMVKGTWSFLHVSEHIQSQIYFEDKSCPKCWLHSWLHGNQQPSVEVLRRRATEFYRRKKFQTFSSGQCFYKIDKCDKPSNFHTVYRANGTCLCKSSKSLSNLHQKQILIEKKLKKLVYNFVEITAAMQMIFPAVLHSCLNAYKKGDLCTLHDLRIKRSIFSSDNSLDEIKKVTHVFNRISKRY